MGNIVESLRGNLRSRLPILLIGMIAFGCVLFGAVAIVPQWKIHEDLAAQIDEGQQAVAATMTQQSQSDAAVVLQRQVEGAQAKLRAAGEPFLTQAQVDDLLRKLYNYADASGAKIANLQGQPVPGVQQGTNTVYDTRVVKLQVTGSFIELMNFVILLREASGPGVAISGLSISKSEAQYQLSINLALNTSPYASGKAFAGLAEKPTALMIALAVTRTPTPTPTQLPSPTPRPPTATPVPPTQTPTLAGQCGQQDMQRMRELHFAQIQQGLGNCDVQAWDFKLDKQLKFVMDIVRRSGSGQYRLELHDGTDKVLSSTLSSVDGRGILVAEAAAGDYSLYIVPLAASGAWAYDIAIWQGIPALSFAWAQNSYSSHTGIGTKSNTMTWSFSLTGGQQSYRIQATRTDGNLEYTLAVLDSFEKQLASTTSRGGNVTLPMTTGAGTFLVRVITEDGTSGSYRIALAR